jgi:hypothetical protein
MADDFDARIARLDVMIDRAKTLPSWPTMGVSVLSQIFIWDAFGV